MPDFRANITSGFDNIEERYRQLADDFSSKTAEKKPNPKEEEIQKTTSSLLHEFANLLKDASLASKTKEHRMLFLQKDRIKEVLLEFRNMLSILIQTDESYNPDFVLQISVIWNHIIDTSGFVKMVDIHKSIRCDLLQQLIANLENYPQSSDFSLSYYMMHFPGESWHPFPLMEMLRNLHQEAHNDLDSSKLKEWVSLLDAIIPSA